MAKKYLKLNKYPSTDGGTATIANWIEGKMEVEILRFYDEDKGAYDNEYTVMEQYQYEKGSWKGTELGSFKSLTKAKAFAEKMIRARRKK